MFSWVLQGFLIGFHTVFGPTVLGGSWVVISRVISRVTILITHIKGLITPLITTHEPPSEDSGFGFGDSG